MERSMSGSQRSVSDSNPIHSGTKSIDLEVHASLFSSGWQTALHRAPKLEVESYPLEGSGPGVVSFQLRDELPAVSRFVFAAEHGTLNLAKLPSGKDRKKATAVNRRTASDRTKSPTRIKPPAHTVKLEERLWYLLQPSLEEILTEASLHLPFDPFPYQIAGIAFLFPRYAAVLADEMGLGKTMQAITSVRLLLHAAQVRRILLVCPKPLVTNWQREFSVWAPEIPLNVISGNAEQRGWKWNHPEAVLTLANYELVQRDHCLLHATNHPYDLVLLDEAQRIKNRKGATSAAVRGIPRMRSWALTGTPVENSIEDLVGIFEFVAPGQLDDQMRASQMANRVSDYVLRRTKDQVLTDLPPKLVRNAVIDLTPAQRESYRRAEEEGTVRLSRLGSQASVTHVFELILRLKQICNFDPSTDESAKADHLLAKLDEIAASGKKAIVFSQYVASLERLSLRLKSIGSVQYHGKIRPRVREQALHQFREDPQTHVILMSYGAGSVGLNLQVAEYVFLFDRWWNPAIEDQAINRAHRIGAAGPVTVTRFLAQATIEERIDEILEQKREIFETIFSSQGSTPQNMGLSQKEIFGLFNLHSPQGPISGVA
ncbi:MAG: DEAD/DEAH box helicase [Planctomycetota bacterium]|nr:DEAD/DEAH box helicase [Planctomycetota bacterium]